MLVVDHNLAFSVDCTTFWQDHIFRDARQEWSPAFQEDLTARFRDALGELDVIWAELPEEWTEDNTSLTCAKVREILSRFDQDGSSFWTPS